MRHFTLFLLVLLVNTWNLYGQNHPFSFGVKVGTNLSNAVEETNYAVVGNKKSKFGYQVGVTTEYNIDNSLYARTGLSLSSKGTIREGEEMWIGASNPPVTNWKKMTSQVYLQLPLTIGYKTSLSSLTKVKVNAGPYFAYGITGKEIVKTKTTPSNAREDEKITNKTFNKNNNGYYSPYNLNRKDYGVVFGIGIQHKKIIWGLDYEIGLLNIYETDKTEISPSPGKYKNRNLALIINYVFK